MAPASDVSSCPLFCCPGGCFSKEQVYQGRVPKDMVGTFFELSTERHDRDFFLKPKHVNVDITLGSECFCHSTSFSCACLMFMLALLYIFSFNRNITLACSNRLSGFQSSGSSVSEVKSSLSPPWYYISIGSFSFLNIIAVSKTHRKSFQTYLMYINSKGVSLVACTLVRYAKRTAGRWSSQSVWVSLTTLSSVICRVWLNLSVNPLVCG